MKELIKPSICPECKGTDIRRIIGGRPTPEAWEMVERGEAVLGSCFLERKWNDWRCIDCNYEWYDPDDPARQEMEALLEKILKKLGR
jgi:ribosomal protein L37AE/L43A